MHIKVNDILAQEVGYQTSFDIADEAVELDGDQVADNLSGTLTIIRLDDRLLVRSDLSATVQLECHRCLRTFAHKVEAKPTGEFSTQPSEDQYKIAKDYTIDLDPMIRQEVILQLPIKQLCEADCPGLCPECGKRLDNEHTPHNKKD